MKERVKMGETGEAGGEKGNEGQRVKAGTRKEKMVIQSHGSCGFLHACGSPFFLSSVFLSLCLCFHFRSAHWTSIAADCVVFFLLA